jgi:protein-S-isoprenylcysteine O-methyltransferase Ste14
MPQAIFEWVWLTLWVVITVVRQTHLHRAGLRVSLRGIPIFEATMMLLWGLAAGVLPLAYMFTTSLDFANFDVPVGLGVVGAALFVGAIWLLHRSHADLGKHWSPSVEIKENHTLVTEGVYKRIRHPMYAAHVVWGIAQTLLIPNVVAGPMALLLIVAVLALRVPREEQAMAERFGEVYHQYVKRTGRFLPKRLLNPHSRPA